MGGRNGLPEITKLVMPGRLTGVEKAGYQHQKPLPKQVEKTKNGSGAQPWPPRQRHRERRW